MREGAHTAQISDKDNLFLNRIESNSILDSDIDKSYLELSSQGNSIKDITRCQMLGKLLEDKLYAHQAIQDSIIVRELITRNEHKNEILGTSFYLRFRYYTIF